MSKLEFSGCVEATKSLRNKDVPVPSRVEVAYALLNDQTNVHLPRKETVLLNWALDLLSDDKIQGSQQVVIWQFFTAVWELVPESGKQRSFRNHKFVTCLANAFSDEDMDCNYVLLAFIIVAKSLEPLMFATESQISRLVLMYLTRCSILENNSTLDDFKTFFLKSMRSRSKLFSGKLPDNVLDLILCEPNTELQQLFLKDYLSSPERPVIPSELVCRTRPVQVKMLITELVVTSPNSKLESHIEEKVIQLVNSFASIDQHGNNDQSSDYVCFVLQTLNQFRPFALTPALATKILNAVFTPAVIEQVLKLRSAAIFDTISMLEKVLQSINVNSHEDLMVLMLIESSQQRKLLALLLDWQYTGPVSNKLQLAFQRAVDSLSVSEVCQLINSRPATLALLISSLSYKTASNKKVHESLQLLCNEAGIEDIKLAALQVSPTLIIRNSDSCSLKLRQMELQLMDLLFADEVLESLSDNYDYIALRYFPLLTTAASSESLTDLLAACLPATRDELSKSSDLLELPKLASLLIDVLIQNNEFSPLNNIPKQLFTWEQRHSTVEAAIKSTVFSDTGRLVSNLLDSEHLPTSELLAKYLDTAEQSDAATYVRIVQKSKSIQQLLTSDDKKRSSWQSICKRALNNEAVKFDAASVDALNAVVTFLPLDVAHKLAIHTSAHGKLDAQLFEVISSADTHWSIVTALFIASDCSDTLEEIYSGYCRRLEDSQLYNLYMQCTAEDQFAVLRTLINHQVFPQSAEYNFKFTYAICKLEKPTRDYWMLCEAIVKTKKLSQFNIEVMLQRIQSGSEYWSEMALVLSRIIVLKRNKLRGRLHLVVAALDTILMAVESKAQADAYARLIDNLCNPQTVLSQTLTSVVSRERRAVEKHAAIILQNFITIVLKKPSIGSQLRESMFPILGLLGAEGLRSVAAYMDTSSQAYLRALFDEYKLKGQWLGD